MYKIYEDDYAYTAVPHMDSDGCIELFWDHPEFPNRWSNRHSPWPYGEHWGDLSPLSPIPIGFGWDTYYILLNHFGLAEVKDDLEFNKIAYMSPEELHELKNTITEIRKARPLIFISYSREDSQEANQLYDSLYRFGFNVWLDKRDILPGEQWELAVEGILSRSDFVLVCCSKKSEKKRGYLRKEIVLALDKSLHMLDTDIYLITVRIDDCEIPTSLSRFQWVDLFSKDGLDKLVHALRIGMERRGLG